VFRSWPIEGQAADGVVRKRLLDKESMVSSSHTDLMRRAYRATHSYVYMVWDGRRWLQQVDGQWVRV
jgi:hypothetical protein